MLISRDNANYDQLLSRKFYSGNFLQSSIWKDFLTKQHKQWWQLSVSDDQGLPAAVCLLYENKIIFNLTYLYSPKGPIFINDDLSLADKQQTIELILSQIRDIVISTREHEELFCKLELAESLPEPPRLVKSQNVQPAETWVLDLRPTKEQLLAAMHSKTRYNISLAQRRGVKIKVGYEARDLRYFLRFLTDTAKRQQVKFHSPKYYQLLWQTLLEHGAGALYLGENQGKIIAANIMINFGQATTYLHGVLDYRHRQLMAPHLLQWQAIQDAKDQGQQLYDFWGIASEQGQPSNWQGITRFKLGFGGRRITSPGAQNFIYNKQWYGVYLLLKRLRRLF